MKQYRPQLILLSTLLGLALALPAAARGGGGGGGLGRGGGGLGRGGGIGGIGGGRGGAGGGAGRGGLGRGRDGGPRPGDGSRPGRGERGGRLNNRRMGAGLGGLRRRHRWPVYYPGWWFYGGFYGGRNWYRSPFYDPFYDGFYFSGQRYRNEDRAARAEEPKDNVETKVSPENTSIYVNGLLYSSKGKAHFNLPSGKWNVELRAPGYQTQTMELEVQQGQRYTIERKLERE